jgi:uncharacterized protein (TIGR03437 family)
MIACMACSVQAEENGRRFGPAYSSASLVNSASSQPGPIAPNTIVSLYGTGLAWDTRAVQASDIRDGFMPTVLPGTGVRVLVNGISAHLYYVSPRQVNLLIPANLIPGRAELRLLIDGIAGPAIRFELSDAAPGLFLQGENLAAGVSATGTLYTRDRPASPGDWIVLFGTGLGRTIPPASPGEIPRTAAPLADMDRFAVLLDSVPLERRHIGYAGLAPGFAGLYQVNLRLPDSVAAGAEIRLVANQIASPPSVRLPVAR